MSESFTVVPVTDEVRTWLRAEGHTRVPEVNGRLVTLQELERVVASISTTQAEWGAGKFRDCSLKTTDGKHTHIIVGASSNAEGYCEFHFRGGDVELIEAVVATLSIVAGPQLLHAHSGSVSKVIYAANNRNA